jgi:hypothetical protein
VALHIRGDEHTGVHGVPEDLVTGGRKISNGYAIIIHWVVPGLTRYGRWRNEAMIDCDGKGTFLSWPAMGLSFTQILPEKCRIAANGHGETTAHWTRGASFHPCERGVQYN